MSTPAATQPSTDADQPEPAAGQAPDRPVLVPHVAEQRLTAQHGFFAGPTPIVPAELYAEVTAGTAERDRGRIELAPRSRLTMNTYFGRFPASWWQRWTVATEVTVEGVASGRGRVSVVASDQKSEPRVLAVHRVDSDRARTFSLTVKIDRFVDGGALWLEVESGGAELALERVRWTVDAPAAVRPTAVVICTFNRVDDCLNTLSTLVDDTAARECVDAVYVVDQGSDAVESRPRFAELAERFGDGLRYIRQPNLGGAGGFSRGLYEVAEVEDADHANVLFMDDDVVCEPDIIVRLTAFANRTVEPIIVGGQMLNLLHPDQLHVGAEWADLAQLAPAQVSPGAPNATTMLGTDSDGVPNVQDLRVDAGYNGWWSCLIPSEIVKAIGYPLPLFFQWDDIEYGYRSRAHGFPTTTLPGAGVWHADFGWKDWDDWHRYFNLRNAMITGALHGPRPAGYMARVMFAQLLRYLVSMQYGLGATLIKAVEDFLAGPEGLRDGGMQAAKDIRELRARYPETVRHPASAVPEIMVDYAIVDPAGEPSLKRAVLLKRLVTSLRGRHPMEFGAVRAAEAHWWHVSLFKRVVVTDASQEGVRLRTYDRGTFLELARRGVVVMRRLRREAEPVAQRYRAAMPELTSRQNWRRLYDS